MGAVLMRKMGWREGEGLGKNKEGNKEPILVDFKTDRKGNKFFWNVYYTYYLFLVVLGFQTRGLALARQVLYYRSHIPSPFSFSYFSGMFLSVLCGRVWTTDLLLIIPWDYRCVPPCPAFLLRCGLQNVLSGLALGWP
jgi:hypothetical protein